MALQQRGELEAACDAYRFALALDSDSALARSGLACGLGERGNFEAALHHATSAIGRQPENPLAYVVAALADTGRGRLENALEGLEKARALAPDDVAILTEYAGRLRKLGRCAEALEYCPQAAALQPGNGKAQHGLGLIYSALGRLTSHFIKVDYETVVADLEDQARRLISFYGLAWDDSCLSFHATQRIVRTASKNQVRQPLYRNRIGRRASLQDYLRPLIAVLEDRALATA
ncbi:MAG TPA: tetratricopeptide repeat protein [Acetobacteraceae bacterium]|nr:tetratricopeptide repeat protein [Acetobacteraceae bacterium]